MSKSKKRGLPKEKTLRHDLHFVEALEAARGASTGQLIETSKIDSSPYQPRKTPHDIDDLVSSIKEKGILQPLLVRPKKEGDYELVAGERRFKASIKAGLKKVPCIIKELSDAESLEISLIENLQREDLSPLDEAEGLKKLKDHFGYTHAKLAKRIGKSRSYITETLRLNDLPEELKEKCRPADIRSKSALLAVTRQPDEKKSALLDRVINEGLTRSDIRKETRKPGNIGRPSHYQYKFQPETKEFIVEVRFRKVEAEVEEIIQALKQAIKDLK